MSKLLRQYKELLLVIFLIILKLITKKDAPYSICINYRANVKWQICYIFLNVLEVTMMYPDIIVLILSNAYLRSGNTGLVLLMQVVKTGGFKISFF